MFAGLEGLAGVVVVDQIDVAYIYEVGAGMAEQAGVVCVHLRDMVLAGDGFAFVAALRSGVDGVHLYLRHVGQGFEGAVDDFAGSYDGKFHA